MGTHAGFNNCRCEQVIVGVRAGRVTQRGARWRKRGAGTVGHHIVGDLLQGRRSELVHGVLGHTVHRGRQEGDPGGQGDWLHGHWSGNAGVACYPGWKTTHLGNVSPDTDWVVMCGTNAGSQLKLVNGVDVGTATGGTGGTSLFVNGGYYRLFKSEFAIAEVAVWPRGLTSAEMRRVSDHLMSRMG